MMMTEPLQSPPVERFSQFGGSLDHDRPSRLVIDNLTTRWGLLVLAALQSRTKRFAELRREVTGISEKMLAQTLRTFERDGWVSRESQPIVPPHVEYSLTPLGHECAERFQDLAAWIEKNLCEVATAQLKYDERTRQRYPFPSRQYEAKHLQPRQRSS